MAAITPHLEQYESTDEELAWAKEDAREVGMSGLAGGKKGVDPAEITRTRHGELVRMAMTRQAVLEELRKSGLQYRVQFGDARGANKGTLYLVVGRPDASGVLRPGAEIGSRGPEWNSHLEALGRGGFEVLAWTSKMDAPSFSLPAGAKELGGACPGAVAGQTTSAKASNFVAMETLVRKKTDYGMRGSDAAVWFADAVCQGCVTGDTRILVRGRGLVTIESMVGEGDFEVWSGVAWRTTNAIHTGIKKTWRIETNWGLSCRVSDDHEIIDASGEKVLVTELEAGDALLWAPGESPFPGEASLGYVRLAQEHPNQLPDMFPLEWSSRVGVLLGYIVGDGNVYKDGRGYTAVSIGKSVEQREEITEIASWVREWSGSEAQIVETPPEDLPVGSVRGQGALLPQEARIETSWKTLALANFVRHCGVDKSDPSAARLPRSVWTASHNGVRGFLQGLFATDGSVTDSKGKIEVSIASVSRALLQDVQLLLGALGIKSTICAYKKSNEMREREDYRALFKLGINAIADVRLFAERVGFFARVKQEKLEKLLETSRAVGRTRHPVVKSAAPTGVEEPVYDLVNVGPELTYVGNGLRQFDCYAEGGNYAYSSKQLASLLIFQWTKDAVASGEFVPMMVEAINRAPFAIDRFYKKHGVRMFRIHDSGDFYGKAYLRAWKQIADHFVPGNPHGYEPVVFWAPTRIWAVEGGIAMVNEINAEPRNLIIRPSAYHINTRAIRGGRDGFGPGWAQGSTVTAAAAIDRAEAYGLYDWNCPAYASSNAAHSCTASIGPDKGEGCRACWVKPDISINYKLH